MNELHVCAQSRCELLDIDPINRDDLVAVVSEQHYCGVDHIGQSGLSEEHACRPSERLVKGANVDSRKCLGESALSRPTTPDLSENPGVSHGWLSGKLRCLEPNPHLSLIAFEGNQRSAVEDQTHADFALRLADG